MEDRKENGATTNSFDNAETASTKRESAENPAPAALDTEGPTRPMPAGLPSPDPAATQLDSAPLTDPIPHDRDPYQTRPTRPMGHYPPPQSGQYIPPSPYAPQQQPYPPQMPQPPYAPQPQPYAPQQQPYAPQQQPYPPQAPQPPYAPQTHQSYPPPPVQGWTPTQYGPPPQGFQAPYPQRRGSAQFGLKPNFTAMLCYLPFLGLAASIYLNQNEPRENLYVRFHAKQGIFAHVAFWVMMIALAIGRASLPGLAGLLFAIPQSLLTIAAVAGFIFMMVRTYQGKTVKIPVFGDQVDL